MNRDKIIELIENSLYFCIFTNLNSSDFVSHQWAKPYKLYIIKTYNQDLDIGYFNGKEWVTEFGHIEINSNVFEITPLNIYESLIVENKFNNS